MWHPEPGWQPLTSGTGSSTVGVWLAGDRVVKRLGAPLPGDPAELSDPRHVAYWRRPADVAVSGLVDATPGLRSPVALAVEEDDDGVTVWLPQVPERPPSGLFVARSLAVFAGVEYPTGRGWPATSCGTGCAWSSGAAAGRRWPAPRSRTSPTTSGGAARPTSTRLDALPQVPSTATRPRPTSTPTTRPG